MELLDERKCGLNSDNWQIAREYSVTLTSYPTSVGLSFHVYQTKQKTLQAIQLLNAFFNKIGSQAEVGWMLRPELRANRHFPQEALMGKPRKASRRRKAPEG